MTIKSDTVKNNRKNLTQKQNKRKGAGRGILLIMLLITGLSSCFEDDLVESWIAQQRVAGAYNAKVQQCTDAGQPTPEGAGSLFLVLVPNDVKEGEVAVCEAELLAASCPLLEVPFSCLLLMLSKADENPAPKILQ